MPRNAYWLILVVILVLGVGYYSWLLRENDLSKRLTIGAPATVTRTEVIRYVDPIFGNETLANIDVTYQYVVDGQRYERTVRMSKFEASAFIPWGDAKVCYDPADRATIEKAALFPPTFSCGQ